jgi:ribonuclease-3
MVDNEVLEFLGDAVLGFVIADLLFREFPDANEGIMSKWKATLVSTATLANLGGILELGDYMLVSRGEEKTGGRKKKKLLADTYEALITAVYLDGGVSAAQRFIEDQFRPIVSALRMGERPSILEQDDKSALQELVQARSLTLPEYRVVREDGPAHRKVFCVEVCVDGDVMAHAEGSSKQAAEQRAASLALRRLTAG